MTAPRSKEWDKVRDLEDMMAFVALIGDKTGAIRKQAWHQGDWGMIYRLATQMEPQIQELRAGLSKLHEKWIREARE